MVFVCTVSFLVVSVLLVALAKSGVYGSFCFVFKCRID